MNGNNNPPHTPDRLLIPAMIRIGVTGHRVLPDEATIRISIQQVIDTITNQLPHTPCKFTILSPLAEGADRIVASEFERLNSNNQEIGYNISSSLISVLPLPKDDYMQDFKTPSSKEIFEKFLQSAEKTIVLNLDDTNETPKEHRRAAYEQVGQYIVHNCDILIAIWNGKKAAGRGGTEEIFRYAETNGRTCAWIHSETGAITWYRREDDTFASLENLDQFNTEKIKTDALEKGIEKRFSHLTACAGEAGLPSGFLDPLHRDLLPLYGKASYLAKKYRNFHTYCGISVYVLAAFAVIIVTTQVLFFSDNPYLILPEILVIIAIIILVQLSNNCEWHRKWLDYRFLAERLRAMSFLSVLCTPAKQPSEPTYLSHRPKDWVVMAHDGIQSKNPNVYCSITLDDSLFESVKTFILKAWIDEQITFYSNKEKHLRGRNQELMLFCGGIFFITFIAAFFHFFGHFLIPTQTNGPLLTLFAALAISLPAVGSSVTAIRNYREYQRNSERYGSMVQYLTTIRNEINRATTREKFIELVKEADEVMMKEHMDWRILFTCRSIEVL